MRRYFEDLRGIIERHGGTVEKFVGDAVMAVFGIPVSHEDDALRAVRAAWEMRASIAEHGLEARIGINTGEVVVGYIGSSKTMEYTAVGDGVNTASRLCSTAKAGEIIISESTYQAARDFIEASALPPTKVKGKREPLAIYSVLGRRGEPTMRVARPQEPTPSPSG